MEYLMDLFGPEEGAVYKHTMLKPSLPPEVGDVLFKWEI